MLSLFSQSQQAPLRVCQIVQRTFHFNPGDVIAVAPIIPRRGDFVYLASSEGKTIGIYRGHSIEMDNGTYLLRAKKDIVGVVISL